MNSYEFCADFAFRSAMGQPGFKVLDFGCGAGEAVGAMRQRGLDAYGCDPYYEGGDLHSLVPREIGDRVFRMQGDRVPFPDQTFDLVVTNVVLEHVPDLDASVSEIARVLKPGASCLAIFPHLEVWREGHCEIPFLHRFPKGSTPRIYYAAALRCLGLGASKGSASPMDWARSVCKWLDEWCYYRPLSAIRATFRNHLSEPQHIEAEWMAARSVMMARLPRSVRVAIVRKGAGLVFVATRPDVATRPCN